MYAVFLLLPLVARFLETIDVCIWRLFVFMSVVGLCGGLWECSCVAAVVKNSVFLSLGVLKYVVCLCRGCGGCCVFCLYCEAWSCRCSCMGSVSVSSCRCCMFVSCVHPVTVLWVILNTMRSGKSLQLQCILPLVCCACLPSV